MAESVECYRAALRLKPDHPHAYVEKALLLLLMLVLRPLPCSCYARPASLLL